MGKVKIKKKSTLIDMTAMSDVTVLLLTFFMLTSTFLTKEPTVVQTPSSVSEEMIPAKDLVTVLVSSADKDPNAQDPTAVEGKIFLSFTGDSVISSETLRGMVLDVAVAKYNKLHKNQVTLTDKMKSNFKKANMLGMPFSRMEEILNMDPTTIDKLMTELDNPGVGIPINGNKEKEGNLNDFQVWMFAIAQVASDERRKEIERQGLVDGVDTEAIRNLDIIYNSLYQGRGVSIKADKDTPFNKINEVFDNLQTMGLNKFTLQTALKTE